MGKSWHFPVTTSFYWPDMQVRTFPIKSKAQHLSDLCDGLVFGEMLGEFKTSSIKSSQPLILDNSEDFDEQYGLSDLEKHPSGPTQWLNKKTVLETVFRALIRYIRTHTKSLEHLTASSIIDFNKIAEHDDGPETLKVPKLQELMESYTSQLMSVPVSCNLPGYCCVLCWGPEIFEGYPGVRRDNSNTTRRYHKECKLYISILSNNGLIWT